MKVGRDYSWWVDYSFEYDILCDGEWLVDKYFDSGRFDCLKKDIKKTVTEHIKTVELKGENYRNLKVSIIDAYMTTTEEI